MRRRPVTSEDPWQNAQDELDRTYEHAPAGERALFPPSPASPASPVTHHAPAATDDISSHRGRGGHWCPKE